MWAFGCVLYEMLTARRAFEGEDVSDTLAAVLRGEPDFSALPSTTPPAVRTLIKRCLERDRRRRVANLATALFVFDEAAGWMASSVVVNEPDESAIGARVHAAVAEARRALIRKRFLPAVALLLAMAGAAGFALWLRPPTEAPPVARFTLTQPGLSGAGLGRPVVAISHDGKKLAFTSNRELTLRPIDDFSSRPITAVGTADAIMHSPVFSPDDREVAFFGEGVIRRVPVAGGAVVTVCSVRQPWGMSWHATGLIVAQGPFGIVRCAPNGAPAERLVTLKEGESVQGPQVLPGDEWLLFSLGKTADGVEMWDKADVVVQSLATGERRTILSGGTDARYVPTGHLLYAVGGVVFAAPFDVQRRQIVGAAVPVIEGVRRALATTGTSHFTTSSTGSLVYVPGPAGTSAAKWTLAVSNRTEPPTFIPVQPGPYNHVRASRDGTHLAVGSDDAAEAIVWIHRRDGNSAMRRLTLIGRNRYPIWLPDGQRVAFQSDREGDTAIFVQRIDGSESAERLTKPAAGETHIPEAWSPDGKHLLFTVYKASSYSLWDYSVADRQITPFGNVQSREPIGAVFSPDGRWVAYAANPGEGGLRSPNRGVFLQPFPPTGATHQMPSDIFDFHPVWNPKAKGLELIYVPSATSGELSAVSVTTDSGIGFGSPTRFPALLTGQRVSSLVRAWDLLPDGRVVGVVNAAGSDASAVTTELRVVINWFSELSARAPVQR